MVKQFVMPRRLAAAALIAALAASGCGIKGPLVPPPKATAETPAAKDAAPAEKKP
jgi:predicted small lipoprotein YifL